MAIPSVYTNEHRKEAERVASRYQAEIDEIELDRDLTEEGRARQKQEAYERAKAEMDRLRSAERQEAETVKAEAERALFALPAGASSSDILSMRDATDRASNIGSPSELTDVMVRSLRSGDFALAKAVLARAFELESRSTLSAYLAERPQDERHVQTLIEARSSGGMLGLSAYMLTQP